MKGDRLVKRAVIQRLFVVVVVVSFCFVIKKYVSGGKSEDLPLMAAVGRQTVAADGFALGAAKTPRSAELPYPTEEPIVGALPTAAKEYGFDAREIAKRLRAWDFSALPSDSVEEEQGKPEKKIAFLTFDDGPSANNTPQILDILEKEKVHATFFVQGSNLERESLHGIMKRELSEGNAIGNHTYDHEYKKLYPNRRLNIENFKAELEMCDNKLKEVLGKNFQTRIVRCPGGSASWKGMKPLIAYFERQDMVSLDWNVEVGDALRHPKTAAQLVATVKEACDPSVKVAVLLMHDSAPKCETVKALPEIIKYLKKKGFEFKILV
jgi:peptidoglycan/xylan/chitin deacetylase (PgdA/CDA1 family)